MAGVGSEKLFENDKVIVWNFELKPGEQTPIHTHEHSYVWYSVQGTDLQVFDEHGNDLGTLEVPTGSVYSLKVEDGVIDVMSEICKGVKIPARHSARNAGTTHYREILVEYKT